MPNPSFMAISISMTMSYSTCQGAAFYVQMICTLAKAFNLPASLFPHFLLAHCYRILQIVMTHVNNVSASPGKAEYVNGNMRMEMEMEMETKQGS